MKPQGFINNASPNVELLLSLGRLLELSHDIGFGLKRPPLTAQRSELTLRAANPTGGVLLVSERGAAQPPPSTLTRGRWVGMKPQGFIYNANPNVEL